MSPASESYLQLRESLHKFQKLAQNPSWQPLPEGPKLEPGQRSPLVPHLRHMLSLYGDYPVPTSRLLNWFNQAPPIPEDKQLFDRHLVKGLIHFQQRHGAKADGILGRQTRKLLNTPPDFRVKQIALNMKRWRQLPRNLGERYIWVNLMDYRLQLINHGHTELEMKVIVGRKFRPTPTLYESINSLVLNPQWNVPRRIMLYDILPKAKQDPSYLSERNIRVLQSWSDPTPVPLDSIDWDKVGPNNFSYRLRQDAGKENALGSVKFVLPNDMSIYLHDTNQPELFEKDMRALSSGCVRLEKPLELARALLAQKPGWNQSKIQEALAKGSTQYVRLPVSVPTYLTYWTAWVDDRGILQFRDDIYRRDKLPSDEPTKLVL